MSTETTGSVALFSGLKLRTKILFLPAIVSLFMITIGVLSYTQLAGIEARVADVTEVQSPLASQASHLLQNTLQKNSIVARYLRTGNDELIQQFKELSKAGEIITDGIQQLNDGAQHDELKVLIEAEKGNFNTVFSEQVVVETKKRDAILTELLSVTAPKIENTLSDIVALSTISGEVKPASVANEVLSSFLVARIYLGSYIQNNQEQNIDRFELEIMGAESAIADLSALVDDPRRTALIAKVSSALEKYSASFDSIVESTNARNKAVSGDLAESRLQLIDAATELQTSVWTQFEGSALSINESISEMNTVTIALTAIAVVIGMVLAIFVSRGISKPIVRAVAVANAIANDKLDNEIQVSASGEAGQLLSSLQNMQQTLRDRIDGSRVEARRNGRVKSALDSATSNVMMVDESLNIIYLNQAMSEMMRGAQSDIRQVLPAFDIDTLVGTSVEQLHPKRADYRMQLEALSQTLTEDLDLGGRSFRIVSNPVVDTDNTRVGTVFEWTDRTVEISVENEVNRIVAAAQAGDLSQRIDGGDKVGFFRTLSVGVNELVDVADCVVKDTVRVISALAQGDLTQTIDAEYQGAFNQLKCDANETVSKLRQVIGEVQGASSAVKVGVDEIVKGNMNLNQRTEEQAVYLVQTTSSMDELTSTVRQNADSANEANKLAAGANRNAEKGGTVVSNAVAAMGEINESSRKIADIIGVIDEIAFQTNLLALNAAVEAARAGEQGRGFAVVASEVRDLAQRSATAAKEIKELIDDSLGKVNDGSRLVEESGQTLDEIVVSVKQVSAIVSQIAHASAEQSAGIEQVNKSVMQLDTMTQQNAVLVEKATSAAGLMGEQTQSMQNLMSFFSLHGRTQRDGQLVLDRAVLVNRRAA